MKNNSRELPTLESFTAPTIKNSNLRRHRSVPASPFLWALVIIVVFLFRRQAAASGQLDLGFYAEPNAPVYACATAAAYGTVLIGGDFTYLGPYTRNHIALLYTNGASNLGFSASINGPVYAIATQADGKILVGGNFSEVNGVGRIFMARLNADGTLDTGYLNPKLNGIVRAIAVQPDQKILAAGDFTWTRGFYRYYLARFLSDGSVDPSFSTYPYGPSSPVTSVAVSAELGGLITIGGYFTAVGGQGRNFIAMLNPDATLFTQFNPGSGANNYVYAVAQRNWNEIYCGGIFTTFNGFTRNRVAGMDDYGVLNLVGHAGGVNDEVRAMLIENSGSVLIGGRFTTVDGANRQKIARYDPGSGYVDSAFDAGSFYPSGSIVNAICVQSDGKIIIGGSFSSIQGQPRYNVARLLP